MKDRVSYILGLDSKITDRYENNLAIYRALIGCLDVTEISKLLIHSIEYDFKLRDLVNRKIYFDLSSKKICCYEDLACKLLRIVKNSQYRVALSAVMTLSIMLPYLSSQLQLDILKTLTASKWKLFRKRAYKFIKEHYSEAFTDILITVTTEFADKEICEILIDNFEPELLIEVRHFLLHCCPHPSYIPKLYTKISTIEPELISELLEYDSCTYCYTLYKLDWSLEPSITNEVLIDNAYDLDFLCWCLGRLGEWDKIIEIYEIT